MDIFSILYMIGGLCMFLFGMQVMGDALERRGGGKLKSIIENLTSSPIKGVLLGAGVTAIIQSSSATTVMVVGFVNSGIMKLSQAISVIMGANIGTTITAWLLSLTGIESSSLFVQLLKPSSFSPILALVGIIFLMFSKSTKKKDTGTILLGFAVLMTGMDIMSDAVSGLKENQSFTSILTLFSNPILGVLAGAVLTAIIQSSSASVGILQALSTTGQIKYSNAVPIILGQNIGTCITALLSSIGTNKNARRTAVVHLCFNIIGTICFMILFYTLDFIIGFTFIDDSINAAGIAVVHTTFNIFATLLLLPFTKGLEKLSMIIIPEDSKQENLSVLDERLLATPPVAISQAKKLANEMAKCAHDGLVSSLEMLGAYDAKKAEKIRELESTVDKYEDILGTYLVKLSRESLSDDDSREVSNLLHCIGDFERISDHSVNILESAEEMVSKQSVFSGDALRELAVVKGALGEILDITYAAFEQENLELAKSIEPLEQIIDKLKIKLRNNHITRLKNNGCTIETGFVFSDLVTNFERVADHCSNIGVCLLEVANGSFDTHEYLNNVKSFGENDFTEKYEMYKSKYAI